MGRAKYMSLTTVSEIEQELEGMDLPFPAHRYIRAAIARARNADAWLAVVAAACAHLVAEAQCENMMDDEEYESGYCDARGCTYCALARACDALPADARP